ncbi:MAG: discoidin domain-containing protein [Phycisphaeraceae bacterium]|nr:discoidin domain-containing protein [Phycisphaeraceae bacterium]
MRHANKSSQSEGRAMMNGLLLITISALTLALTPARAADESLVLYLALDEGQGTVATDASSYGNNGEIVGDAQWVDGHEGMALEFVQGSHIVVPEIPEHDVTGELSLITWVKNTGTAGWVRMIDKSQWQTSGFDLILTDGAAVPRFEFFVNNTTSLVDASGPVVDGEWHFVAATFGSQTLRMYVDGILEGENGSAGDVDINPNDWPIMVGAESSSNGGWQFLGTLDDVAVFNRELSAEEIFSIFENGIADPGLASTPAPQNKANDVLRNSVLSWTPGDFAGTHNVYVGDSAEEVSSATVPTAAGLTVNSYKPERLEFGKTYYWRVDEVNATPDKFVYKGDTWLFKTEPYAVQIPETAIVASASSSAPSRTSNPEKTIDGSGLGDNDQHSTNHSDMWFSDSPDASGWLMYEFDSVRQLDKMKLWNSNSAAETAIGWGLKDVTLEYSVDGIEWITLEGTTQFKQAPGLDTYNQYDVVNFNRVPAKVVRITILSNYGGFLPAYAVSEVQFFAVPVKARTPNPADQAEEVLPNATATWRAGREAAIHRVMISQDANAVSEGTSAWSNTNSIDMTDLGLQLGQTYYWQVVEVNQNQVPSEWPSEVWTFSTASRIVVDDFEGYNNLSPNRPFQTWVDGFGYSADEHFPIKNDGNGSGAAVGHDIWSLASPYYQGEIMEQILTAEASGQSMPIYYTGGSQVDRTFATAQDWSVAGIKTLVLKFRGDRANAAGKLYVTINGQRVDYPKASALLLGGWTQWNIDLASLGIALNSITTLSIGIESGGSGLVLVDQISLYRNAPEVPVSADPGTTGLEAWYNFEGDFTDASGHGLTGSPTGGLMFINSLSDEQGSAASLNGTDDYVVLPVGPLMSTLTDCTFALWTNFPGGGGNWQRIFDFGSGTGQYVFLCPSRGGDDALLFEMNGPTAGTNLIAAPLKLPSGWHHVAGVIDSTQMRMTLYLDGVLVAQGPTDSVPADMGETSQNWLGRSQFTADPPYNGSVDDFRIYSRVLSEGEIRYLAGDR